MEIICLDIETYYDKEYSLSKMTTESYIRDPRFQVIGVSVKVNDAEPEWYAGNDVAGFIRRTIPSGQFAIICHNAAFDGAILSWHYGIRPTLWVDTMSMARPFHGITTGVSLHKLSELYSIGEKGTAVTNYMGFRREQFTDTMLADYGAYCIQDNNLTYKLFKKLAPLVPASEIELIDMTIRMFTEPMFELDKDVLEEHLAEVQAKKNKFLDRGGDALKQVLMSNDKFAAALRACGVEPPIKTSKTTGKPAYAFAKTDTDFTALQEHPDIRVQFLVSARLGVKSTIEETRTQSFLGIASRGKLPILLNYWGAHPGRFSGGDKVNLQNLPRGGKIRDAIKAPEGHKVVVCDSAQIEARLVAYLAKQDDLVQAFREGRDVYSEFATEIFGKPITKADKIERFIGKTCILGLGYMCGPERFREMLASGVAGPAVHIDETEAKRIVQVYRRKNHKIVSLWAKFGNVLKSMVGVQSGPIVDHVPLNYTFERVILPNNMYINYPGLTARTDGFEYYSRKQAKKIYSGKAVENATQALARLVIVEQMLRIGKKYRVVLQVHDEIVCIVPDDQVEEATRFIKEVMSTPPAWAPDLPVACEIGVGDSYGNAKN